MILSATWWSGYAAADIAQPQTLAATLVCIDQTGQAVGCGPNVFTGTVLGPTFSGTANGVDTSLKIDSSAASGFGDLHADISTAVKIAGAPPTDAWAESIAGFEDIMTVNFAPFTGEQGFMLLDYTLHGTISKSGQDLASGGVTGFVGSQDFSGGFFGSSVDGFFDIPQTFTFIYGQPFNVGFDLIAVSGVVTPSVSATGTSSANFGNTFVLSGITIEDPSGNVLTDAQITSGSGTQYGPNGVLPEPSFIFPIGLGLSVLCLVRLRRHKVVR